MRPHVVPSNPVRASAGSARAIAVMLCLGTVFSAAAAAPASAVQIPVITWEVVPTVVTAGEDIPLAWRLSNFGAVSQNQVHIGITDVLASSPPQDAGNGFYTHAFTAPPVTEVTVLRVIVQARNNDTWDVLSEVRQILVRPEGPAIPWLTPPPAAAEGGSPFTVAWELRNFFGPLTDHRLCTGVTSVLRCSPEQPTTAGPHSLNLTAPNIGTVDSPATFRYAIGVKEDGKQVVSAIENSTVTAGPSPPTVEWIAPPPEFAQSGTQFDVTWAVSNFMDPPTTNTVGWGVTSLIDTAANQSGSNATFTATVTVPTVTERGTLHYAAFAANNIEFAFAPPVAVQITLTPPLDTRTHFPLIPGMMATYLVNGVETRTVVTRPAPEDVNGTPTTVLDHQETGGQENYTNDALGLLFHRVRLTGPGIPLGGALNTFSPPAPVAAPTMVAGDLLVASGTAVIEVAGFPPQTVPYVGTATVTGSETLTVPAGTFDTVRLDISLTVGTTDNIITMWLAPNVGRVQFLFNTDLWQLKSLAIPVLD